MMLWLYLVVILLCLFPFINSLTLSRILSEWKEIRENNLSFDSPFKNSSDECGVRLSPLRNNLLEWHFSFTGLKDSDYTNGIYHGKIILHPSYPQKAPSISLLTPTGRWDVNTEICLSATSFHQETWNPNWNLRTLVLSLRGYMISQPNEIGSVWVDKAVRRAYAITSRDYKCPHCGVVHEELLSTSPSDRALPSLKKQYIPAFVETTKARKNAMSNKVPKLPSKASKKRQRTHDSQLWSTHFRNFTTQLKQRLFSLARITMLLASISFLFTMISDDSSSTSFRSM